MNPTYGINGSTPDPEQTAVQRQRDPTITGQRLIADYTYSLLSAPWELTLLPKWPTAPCVPTRTNCAASGGGLGELAERRPVARLRRRRWPAPGLRLPGQRRQRPTATATTLTLGGSYRIDEAWRAGVAAGFYRQKLEAGAKDSDYRMNSYMASAFVQYQENRWWADAGVDRRLPRLRRPEAQVRPGRRRAQREGRHQRPPVGVQRAPGLRHRPAGRQSLAPVAVRQRRLRAGRGRRLFREGRQRHRARLRRPEAQLEAPGRRPAKASTRSAATPSCSRVRPRTRSTRTTPRT